jgi:predicted DNA-binding transcriptional regulator YafY
VVLGAPTAAPEAGFDPAAAIARSLAQVPWTFRVEVRLDASPEHVRQRIPATLAELSADGEGTLLRMRADSLRWVAEVLAGLGCAFTVHEPDELRAHVAELAALLSASARSAADT